MPAADVACAAADLPAASVAGLVLAAGAGRRMGMPKGLIRLHADGPTLIERAVQVLAAGGCARVVAVVGAAAGQVGTAAGAAGAAVVEVTDWEAGMGTSLRAGLGALDPGRDAAAVVLLVDLPDVESDVVARVLEASTATGDLAGVLARAAYEGRPGHPVVIGRDHWAAAGASAQGDRGARDFLAAGEVLLVECGDLATGRDADTTADLPGASE